MKPRIAYGLAAFAALSAGLSLSLWQRGMPGSPFAVEAAAPADLWSTPLETLEGKPATLAAYRGKPLMVNFWATWCAPCKEEIPEFVALKKTLGDKVTFVGVAIDNAASVNGFMKTMPLNYPVLLGEQPAMDLMRAQGNSTGALPFTALYDAKGTRVVAHPGKLSREKLEAYLKPLL